MVKSRSVESRARIRSFCPRLTLSWISYGGRLRLGESRRIWFFLIIRRDELRLESWSLWSRLLRFWTLWVVLLSSREVSRERTSFLSCRMKVGLSNSWTFRQDSTNRKSDLQPIRLKRATEISTKRGSLWETPRLRMISKKSRWIRMDFPISFSRDSIQDSTERWSGDSSIEIPILRGRLYFFKLYIINILWVKTELLILLGILRRLSWRESPSRVSLVVRVSREGMVRLMNWLRSLRLSWRRKMRGLRG